MPRVSEIPSGSTAERSGEQGVTADSGSRKWRIILDNPGDSYDVQSIIGVRIGDFHPLNANIPCVSISEAADGESRLVRIVTANYKTTDGGDAGGGAGSDPGGKPPDVRPAKISLSSSLIERPARYWWKIAEPPPDGDRILANQWIAAKNPVGDLYDGVTKVAALVNISVAQYEREYTNCEYVGDINSDAFTVQGVSVPKFCCMLRGFTLTPHVETWGDRFFRGWLAAYEFTIDWSKWTLDIPLTGFTVINDGLNGATVDNKALSLVHKDYEIDLPLRLVPGTEGEAVRASVAIHSHDGKWMQRPSALPVLLNENGTPRKRSLGPIIEYYGTSVVRTFGDNFANLGIRINEAL